MRNKILPLAYTFYLKLIDSFRFIVTSKDTNLLVIDAIFIFQLGINIGLDK